MNLHINKPLITLTNIHRSWEHRQVLSNVSLTVHENDFIAITGPNGGGKTTLLRIMLGLLKPSKGYVKHNIANLRIGYLPQKNMIDSNFPVVVRDVIMSGLLGIKGLSDDEKLQMYTNTIEAMDLVEHADRPIGLLSGGQLQRALLGRAIIAKPQLLVLDEPLSYIDKHFESHIYRIIAAIAPNCTIMLVSHEMSTIASMANRHWIIDRSVTECTAAKHYVSSDCDD
jgi:zinc transport system ATP-binding protein